MFLKKIAPFILGLILIASCGNKDKTPLIDSVSAFIQDNEKIVAFGSIDYNSILEKAEYKSIPKLSEILETELKRMGNSIDIKKPIYVAMEGPFDSKANPTALYAFFDVVNGDSLAERLSSSGLFVENDGTMKFSADGDLAIGTKGNLAILITKKEKYDGKIALQQAFKKAEDKKEHGKIYELLKKEGDIVLSVNMENLYGSSNTDLSKLEESKRKELNEMMKNSFTQTTVNFEKGKIALKMDNQFSDALQKRMVFNDRSKVKIEDKLGTGEAKIGLAFDFNMEKLESFIDDFAPEVKKEMTRNRPEIAIALLVLGDNPLTKIFSGYGGGVIVGSPGMGSFVPDVNFNVGVGKEGRGVFELLAAQNKGDYEYTITNTDLLAKTPGAGKESTKLIMPACAKDFGKGGITGFIDVKGLNVQAFGLPSQFNAINLIESITFEYHNKGGELIINFTNKDQNVLKQTIDLYLKDIEKTINSLSI
jgi:hypothetical protein